MFNIDSIPKDSGCYLFKDKKDNVIYVGKAKNLRKRVGNYNRFNNLDLKTQHLVNNVETIDYVITDNEIEAFILENTLIKKYQPKYNIDLKDAKNYSYIRLTDEIYPRILVSRDKKGSGKCYGPFISAKDMESSRDYLSNLLLGCHPILLDLYYFNPPGESSGQPKIAFLHAFMKTKRLLFLPVLYQSGPPKPFFTRYIKKNGQIRLQIKACSPAYAFNKICV